MVTTPSIQAVEAGAAPLREGARSNGLRRRARPRTAGGLLGGMRVRKKLIFLHTLFSVGLGLILLVAIRPAVREVVEQAELSQARALLAIAVAGRGEGALPDASVRTGQPGELGLTPASAAAARASPGQPIEGRTSAGRSVAVIFEPGPAGAAGTFSTLAVRIPESRSAVVRLYTLVTVALLAAYALVAAALELFVLPQHVYRPIRRLLEADRAAREGRPAGEIVPEAAIPADELGEIMRSRNETILALRQNEAALADALSRLEAVATDLRRKNHLLEAARRNLADADRLASLGMMSAGIAHELNTPLAVLKGLVERLSAAPSRGMPGPDADLMLRVVRRLERLGESLLDYARVRPPESRPVGVRGLVDEATTLVRLDRDARDIEFENRTPGDLTVECDGDRMVQVLDNLLR